MNKGEGMAKVPASRLSKKRQFAYMTFTASALGSSRGVFCFLII